MSVGRRVLVIPPIGRVIGRRPTTMVAGRVDFAGGRVLTSDYAVRHGSQFRRSVVARRRRRSSRCE
ncbi:hypothetical protein RHCRD62_30144 [Rhodococcus sp. RD6.2]|nr:hypothetical protein RHCRD62_30144 [Rhodococcus sp. RD6.2]